MSKNTVQILLTAVDKSFSRTIDKGNKKLGEMGKKAETVKRSHLSGFGEALSKGFDKAAGNVKSKISGIGVAAIAATTAALSAMVVASANAAKEIENLARMANMGEDEFKDYAYAVMGVGWQADKLADVSKDVQDKLGDFIATGGGEFKDFFEEVAIKVGLTAEELQGLSGPDVLIAVKKAMDEANVSMEEQVFYLEAIGNDASMLIPLLEDEGKAFREAAKHAKELRPPLDDIDKTNLKNVSKDTKDIALAFAGLRDTVSAEFAPLFSEAIKAATKLIVDLRDEARRLAGVFVNVGESVKGWKAVSEGRLSFLEFATMDAKEFDTWLKKNIASVEEVGKKTDAVKSSAGKAYSGIDNSAKESADNQAKYTKSALDSMKKEYENYVREVNRLQGDISARAKDSAAELREMARSGMTDIAAWRDRRKEAREYVKAAKAAAKAGNFEEAVELADRAKEAYKDLNQEVKAGGKVLISQGSALRTAMSGVKIAGELATDALESQRDAAQEAADALDAKADGRLSGVAASVDETTTKIEGMEKIIVNVGGRWVDVWQDNRKTGIKVLDDLQAKIDKMDGQEITLKVKEVTQKALGGIVHKLKAGGKLSGYGGGDKIPALLEAGEFVIRKEAVKKFGAGAFNMLNGLRIPQFQFGGPVGALASGSAGKSVTINLYDHSAGEAATLIAPTKNDYDIFERTQRRNRRLSSR